MDRIVGGILVLVFGLSVAVAADKGQDKPATPRAAIERSLVYLEKAGVAWKEERKCASCHHIPMTIWTLNAAKRQGFAVNERPWSI